LRTICPKAPDKVFGRSGQLKRNVLLVSIYPCEVSKTSISAHFIDSFGLREGAKYRLRTRNLWFCLSKFLLTKKSIEE
ncbi:hypothetical protein, partial [Prevotella jejuni]|uniref:hypothetical protein n=1 Tax=Prevotella jejuni TaxID=1177574 RepID=UPI003C768AAA